MTRVCALQTERQKLARARWERREEQAKTRFLVHMKSQKVRIARSTCQWCQQWNTLGTCAHALLGVACKRKSSPSCPRGSCVGKHRALPPGGGAATGAQPRGVEVLGR